MEQYIDATIQSSSRSRHTLFLIIVASIIAFCYYWDALPMGWTLRRPIIVAEATMLLESTNSTNKSPTTLVYADAAKAYLQAHDIKRAKEIEIQNEALNKDAIDVVKV